jgi:hypothetical protein
MNIARLKPPRHAPTERHPIHSVVVTAILREGRVPGSGDRIDATRLALVLAGRSSFRITTAMRAYRIIAEDVLGYMRDQGHLVVDELGWYHLPRTELDLDDPAAGSRPIRL